MLWFVLLFLAETPEEYAARLRAQMEASISQQRASARRQSEAAREASPRPEPMVLASRPQLPWPPPSLMSREQPPCDPLPGPELTSLVNAAAQAQNLNPALIREVARQESGFRPCAVSSQGAMGVMQLMPVTQIELGVADPWDPRENIEAGTRLLRQLIDRYNGDLSLALGAYNAGATRVDQAGGVPAIPETRNYVDSILYRLMPTSAVLAPDLPSPAFDRVSGWDNFAGGLFGGP